MKQCSQCKEWKDESEYHKKCVSKDGLSTYCKVCAKAYDDARKEQKAVYRKLYYEQNKDKIRKESRERMKNYYSTHKEERQKYNKEYQKQNKDKISKQRREKEIKYPLARLNHRMSAQLYNALKDKKQERHWEELVPYTLQELKDHLEKQFDENMSWSNIGEYWEIDHIIPQNLFVFDSCVDKSFKICWSLANLRPLEKSLNRRRPKDGRDISKQQAINILGLDLYCDIMDVENEKENNDE